MTEHAGVPLQRRRLDHALLAPRTPVEPGSPAGGVGDRRRPRAALLVPAALPAGQRVGQRRRPARGARRAVRDRRPAHLRRRDALARPHPACRLYRYEFDRSRFRPWDEADGNGQYIASEVVEPVDVVALDDLLALHAAADVELRITPKLGTLMDRILASGLPFSCVDQVLQSGLRTASSTAPTALTRRRSPATARGQQPVDVLEEEEQRQRERHDADGGTDEVVARAAAEQPGADRDQRERRPHSATCTNAASSWNHPRPNASSVRRTPPAAGATRRRWCDRRGGDGGRGRGGGRRRDGARGSTSAPARSSPARSPGSSRAGSARRLGAGGVGGRVADRIGARGVEHSAHDDPLAGRVRRMARGERDRGASSVRW
jgi:hypothetical protein